MRRYEFMMRWREDCDNDEVARNILDEIHGEILLNKQAEVVAGDFQILPREAGGNLQEGHDAAREIAHARYEDEDLRAAHVFPDEIVHPWDQGLNIFPDDHPLAPYERLARDNPSPPAREREKEIFLEVGQKMLPPAS